MVVVVPLWWLHCETLWYESSDAKSAYVASFHRVARECCRTLRFAEAVPLVGVAPPSGSKTPWTTPCLRGESLQKKSEK